jgi:hypothetical protein
VTLTAATNATISDGQGVVTILDDDSVPVLTITDVSVAEGNSGTTNAVLTVSLSAAAAQTVTVNYATANGTALAGADYLSTNGTLTFTAGQTSKSVTVQVIGDTVNEATETLLVNLAAAVNATIGDGQGVVTIFNDDTVNIPPTIVINQPGRQRVVPVRHEYYHHGGMPGTAMESSAGWTSLSVPAC